MKRLLAAIAVLAVVAAAGAGTWLWHQLPEWVGEHIRTRAPGVEFGAVTVNWNGIVVSDVDRPSQSGRSLYHAESVAIRPRWQTLLGDRIEIDTVEVAGLTVTRVPPRQAGETQFVTMGGDDASKRKKDKDKADDRGSRGDDEAGTAVRIGDFRIRHGSAELALRPDSGPEMTVTLEDIDLAAGPFIFPNPEEPIPLLIQARLGDARGGDIHVSGRWDADRRSGYLEVGFSAVDLTRFEQAYASPETTTALDSGTAEVRVVIDAGEGRYSALGTVRMAELSFAGSGSFLGVPADLLETYLARNEQRIEFPFKLEGDIDQRGGYRPVIIDAVLRNVVAILREDHREHIRALLDRGDIDAARRAIEKLDAGALAPL
jgi:hypothetical protein